jgi:surface antigen
VKNFFKLLIGVPLLAAMAYALFANHRSTENQPASNPAPLETSQNPQLPVSTAATAVSAQVSDSENVASVSDQHLGDEAVAPTKSQVEITPNNNPNLASALTGALNDGSPAEWHDDSGSTGSISVSPTHQYGDRECRSYRYVVVRDGDQHASPTGIACRSGTEGEWDLNATP